MGFSWICPNKNQPFGGTPMTLETLRSWVRIYIIYFLRTVFTHVSGLRHSSSISTWIHSVCFWMGERVLGELGEQGLGTISMSQTSDCLTSLNLSEFAWKSHEKRTKNWKVLLGVILTVVKKKTNGWHICMNYLTLALTHQKKSNISPDMHSDIYS